MAGKAQYPDRAKYLNGHFSGELLCLRRVENTKLGTARWLCLCNCGRTCIRRSDVLVNGESTACNYCQRLKAKHANITHGMYKSPEYTAHKSLVQRCYNEKFHQYHDYGGRGIGVCQGCRAFPGFYAAVGPRPSKKHEIDRFPDNSGGYWCGVCEECLANGWPMNMRWATKKENLMNRRCAMMLTVDGVTKHLEEWAVIMGINPRSIRTRIHLNWSHYDAVMTPIKGKPRG